MAAETNTIKAMSDAGIRFLVSARVPGGGRDLNLSANEVELYLKDPNGTVAARFGASTNEYLEWVASDGDVQCAATTTSGHRCKNFISGGGQMEMDDWKKAHGGYCAVHGGEGAPHKK
ncbi:hypothetical protein U8P76_10730 [Rhizobium johnstonii]|uniref:hypothetical protein n=1 Tax=Rhizobium leguminosarum TaxID=384 RepID=UPI0010304171|nr:hypothetical protein [Rhizobium leguminosarum]TBG20624.1 hypothetical protein ELG81_08690 [Rhizobium leguminosarum]TBG46540.1 hypothetical protein ELG75_08705 [Rhizobium leguminosarum]TBG79511.1 hypothetical protein ELG76_09040 [Rhizobium leguminosarum]WSG97224.1 hypothetical protein U8P76_10730 [Rhizobium johnstonii]